MAEGFERENERLREANYQYYVLDAPTLSDAEYDRAMRRLEELEAAHPEPVTPESPTQRVGAAPYEKFERVEHRQAMLSLTDVFSPEELADFDGRVLQRLLASVPQLRKLYEHFQQRDSGLLWRSVCGTAMQL